jgi:hypothetical protein
VSSQSCIPDFQYTKVHFISSAALLKPLQYIVKMPVAWLIVYHRKDIIGFSGRYPLTVTGADLKYLPAFCIERVIPVGRIELKVMRGLKFCACVIAF